MTQLSMSALLLSSVMFALPGFGQNCNGVEIDLITGYLAPVPGATVLIEKGNQRVVVLTSDTLGTVCAVLTPGRYAITVRASGFQSKQVDTVIDALPNCFVLVLDVAAVNDEEPASINGKVANLEGRGPVLWANLRHVIGSIHEISRIGADGRFRFTGRYRGLFELRIVSPEGVIACSIVKAGAGGQFVAISPGDRCP